MKQQLRLPFYFFILIGSFFFYSCNTDERPAENQPVVDIVSKKITYDEFTSKSKASDKLKSLFLNKKSSKGTGSRLYDFNIATDDILMIKKGNYDSYTIPITRDDAPNSAENLVLSRQKDGSYSASLIRYPFTETDRTSLNSHRMINMKGAKVIGLDIEKINAGRLTPKTSQYCRTWTYLICNYGGHEHFAGKNCTRIIGTWSVTYCYTTEEDYWNNSFVDPGNPGNEGGGGAPNPGPGTDPEDPNLEPPILTEPIFTDDHDDKTPCEHLKRLLEEDPGKTKLLPNIKPQIQWLQGKVDEKLEYGVEINRGVNFSGDIAYHPFQVSSGSNYKVILNVGTTMMGWLHSHPKNNTIGLFSFEDIAFLRDGYQTASETAKKEIFTIIVLRDKVDPSKISTYALKVDDIAILAAKVDAVMNNPEYSQTDESEKLGLINQKQVIMYRNAGNQPEKSFLQQFSDFGITLYKANADLTNWSKLSLTTSGNLEVQSSPCN